MKTTKSTPTTLYLVEQDVSRIYGLYFTRAAVSARTRGHASYLVMRHARLWKHPPSNDGEGNEKGVDIPLVFRDRLSVSEIGFSHSLKGKVHVFATGRDDEREPGRYP